MALRNAFEDLVTESTARRFLKAITFAKDPAQRMRVIVDNTLTVSPNQFMANSATAGTVRAWYDPNAMNMVDDREVLRQQMRANYMNARQQRWTFS